MSRITPQLRSLTERVLKVAGESGAGATAKQKSPAAFHVCEKLRPHLATLMGRQGFRALLLRALVLAAAHAPWLRTVQVNAADALEAPDETLAGTSAQQLAEGNLALVAELLGLLVAFVGIDLTLRVVREEWPKLSLDAAESSSRRHT